ncbi:PPOX class F420-dependent oxidoreductase [Amycolatopsis sp. NPDC005232]|uniref:PPOX class F420-dependent oxidoreductase n=1 Tax=Amycolatopsis sp. NPDC005232 TaxID=3157027 RepID=UPI0033AC74DB
MSIAVSKFRDVADGVQAGQFQVGARDVVQSLGDLEPEYRQLLDGPVTAAIAVVGADGLPNLTPVWFDYDGGLVLLNMASHRKKVQWLRSTPKATFLLMNPDNPYHWMSIKATVVREVSEDDPVEGPQVSAQIDKMARKYLGAERYSLRDPGRDERRVLFELRVDRVAMFGRP